MCRLTNPDTCVFFAWPGIAPEFSFQADESVSIEAPRARVERRQGRVCVDGVAPGTGLAIRVRARNGRGAQILVLSREEARNLWKATIGGREHLVLSFADLCFDGDRIRLSSTDPAKLEFGIYPDPDRKPGDFEKAALHGVFQHYATRIAPVTIAANVRKVANADKRAPTRMGSEVAMAPVEEDFDRAARWLIRVPEIKSPAVSEVLLRISYEGDVARLYAGGRLVTDDFYHGKPWEIGLQRILRSDLDAGLELKILPLRKDAPIFFSASARPEFGADGEALALREVLAIPVYRASAEWR